MTLLCCLHSMPVWGEDDDDISVESLIKKVRASEAVYENLDVTVRFDWKAGPGAPVAARWASDRLQAVKRAEQSTIRYVAQSGMYRVESSGKIVSSVLGEEETTITSSRVSAFDGDITRTIRDHGALESHEGYRSDSLIIRPHMLLLRQWHYYLPLSVLLSGHEVLQTSPFSRWSPETTVRYRYRGKQSVDDLQCHYIVMTLLSEGEPARWIHLWLAEDRNCIPVLTRSYFSRPPVKDFLIEARVKKWMEIAPKIWFPKETVRVSYSPALLERGFKRGIKSVQQTERYRVEKISLKPEYKKEFFRKVVAPDHPGTALLRSTAKRIMPE